jgi:hypothetical protein
VRVVVVAAIGVEPVSLSLKTFLKLLFDGEIVEKDEYRLVISTGTVLSATASVWIATAGFGRAVEMTDRGGEEAGEEEGGEGEVEVEGLIPMLALVVTLSVLLPAPAPALVLVLEIPPVVAVGVAGTVSHCCCCCCCCCCCSWSP